jgi:hypothetical protein
MLPKLMLLSATASGLLLLGMPIGSSQEIAQPAPKQQVLKEDDKAVKRKANRTANKKAEAKDAK